MADASYLTIGKLVKRLQQTYPDLSVSKVRYLEDEGLLEPSRTPSGYRLYSPKDVKRLETILYLQKNRFLPLQVIKDELDRAESPDATLLDNLATSTLEGARTYQDDEDKLYPLERIPDELGFSISFVRQLVEAGLISFKRSPQGRELLDGKDIPIVRTADQLRRFGFEPKNLRQYALAANRESPTFEQALTIFGRSSKDSAETRMRERELAFEQMLSLTGTLRTELLKRRVSRN